MTLCTLDAIPEHELDPWVLASLLSTCADIWRQHHDELGGFMSAMAPDGAGEVINLTGLTLTAEMDLALHTGQYR